MYIQSKLVKALTLMTFLFLISCGLSHTSVQRLDCLVGDQCTMMGVLSIKRTAQAAVGILEINGDCISIALPFSIIDNKEKWEDKEVKVSGVIYSHSVAFGVISYTLNDREVLVGACANDKILYLEKISLK